MNDSSGGVENTPQGMTPGLLETLAAPFHVFQPAVAAKRMCRSKRNAVIVTLVSHSLLLGLAILWVIFLGMAGSGVTRDRAAAVLREWQQPEPLGLVPTVILLSCVTAPILCLVMALFFLPTTHVQGSVRETLSLNFRTAVASAGLVNGLVVTVGSVVAILSGITFRSSTNMMIFFAGLLLIPLSALAVILWFSRAMRVVADWSPRPLLTPCCEGCGYDLSHLPAEGRCTECGKNVTDSLEAPHRRPTAWERSAGLTAWWTVNWDVVFHADRFYRDLQTREGLSATRRWTIINFLMLFVCTWFWLLTLLFREILREGGFIFLPHFAASTVLLLAAWLVWRVITLAGTIQWLIQGRLTDARRVHKAAAYETAYLWVYCAYCGTLFTSMVVFDDYWISQLVDDAFGTRIRILGLNMEQLICLLGLAGLSIAWWTRWQRILAAIRWANR